jgi:hypothetical protein
MPVYKSVSDEKSNDLFRNYTSSLNIPQIEYFAIGVQDVETKSSISLMSCTEWSEEFYRNNYAPHDPLRQAVLNTNKSFFAFDELDHIDSFGSYIMGKRKKLNMRNGIVLVDRYKDKNVLLTLATGDHRFKPIGFFKLYFQDLKEIKKDFTEIIKKHIRTINKS